MADHRAQLDEPLFNFTISRSWPLEPEWPKRGGLLIPCTCKNTNQGWLLRLQILIYH